MIAARFVGRFHDVVDVAIGEGAVPRAQYIRHGEARALVRVKDRAAFSIGLGGTARAALGIYGIRFWDSGFECGEEVVEVGRRGAEAFGGAAGTGLFVLSFRAPALFFSGECVGWADKQDE